MNRVLVLVFLCVLVTYVVTETVKSSKQSVTSDDDDNDDYDDYDDDDYDYQLEKGPHKHKHKHKYKLLLLAGGLKSLAAFVAIKIKIILIVIAVIGVIGFILKVFGAFKFAGWNDCPVIHEPAYGLGYGPVAPPEHIEYGSYGNDWSSAEKYARSLLDDYVDAGFVRSILKRLDMAEMMFTVLDVETDQCRRRLVCEIDVKARRIPFLEYAMRLFSRGFEKYRTKDSPTKFEDCSKLYTECTEYSKKTGKRRRRRRRSIGESRRISQIYVKH